MHHTRPDRSIVPVRTHAAAQNAGQSGSLAIGSGGLLTGLCKAGRTVCGASFGLVKGFTNEAWRAKLWVACGSLVMVPTIASGQVEVTLHVDSIPNVTDWMNESRAIGPPNSNGNDGQYATNASTAQFMCADSLDSFTLPAGHSITRVWIDVYCRFDAGTSGNSVRLRIGGAVPQTGFASPVWSQSAGDTSLRWRMGGSRGLDITATQPDGWTQAEIRGLDLCVRRESGGSTLRVDSLRVVVRSETDFDGDGIPDAADPDDDNDGTNDDMDCAPFDASRWRNFAYCDADGDGIGAGSLIAAPCFGEVAPAGFSLVTGDNCPWVFNPNQTDANGDGVGDACVNPGCTRADIAPPYGVLDFFDIIAFLAAFDAMQPQADFNNDSLFNFFDIADFLAAFDAGCCP